MITPGCKKKTEEVVTCPRECICLTEKEANSRDLELCEGEKKLCGHDDDGEPKYCYLQPVDDPTEPTGGQEPPDEEPAKPSQGEDALIEKIKDIDPSIPESLAGLFAASKELDDAVESGDISEEEAEETSVAEERVELKTAFDALVKKHGMQKVIESFSRFSRH